MTDRFVCGVPVDVGTVPAAPPPGATLVHSGPRYALAATPTWAWMAIEGAGRLAVTGGRRIVVDEHGGDPALLATWLQGTVCALLLGQQGRFALHASTVLLDGTAVALAGASGAGKSTTALALRRAGAQLLTDDVTPVELRPEGPLVVPTDRPLHAWPETLTRLGLGGEPSRPVMTGFAKRALALTGGDAAPLAAVVQLLPDGGEGDPHRVDGTGSTRVRATPMGGLAAAAVVRRHVYRAGVVHALWPAATHAWSVAVARALPVWTVHRPRSGWTLDAVTAAVAAVAEAGAEAGATAVAGHGA